MIPRTKGLGFKQVRMSELENLMRKLEADISRVDWKKRCPTIQYSAAPRRLVTAGRRAIFVVPTN